MFEVKDYIIYGNHGVCKVEAVGKLDSAGTAKDRLYYTLEPVYQNGSKIFTPVDNEKVMIRAVLSKEEAIELIDDIKNIDSLWITDEKRRESDYKEAFKKNDCRELVKIIKTIYSRKQTRIAEGKKVTASDERYFRMAEETLCGELAIPLKMEKEEVKQFVSDRVKEIN